MTVNNTGERDDPLKERNAAYNKLVPHGIEGLFTLDTAMTILRMERSLGGLDASVIVDGGCGGEDALDSFFERLSSMERALWAKTKKNNVNRGPRSTNGSSYFTIAVEGLDGSGKSSLVEQLAEELPKILARDNNNNNNNVNVTALAWSTPTASMKAVRDVFDKRGGPVARAFYMISNYMLQYELDELLETKQQEQSTQPEEEILVVIVDRWYTSTVAYSVAWKNTYGGPEAINALDGCLFDWPDNLRPPDVLFLLQVDHEVRKNRVQGRASQGQGGSAFNHWDDRLNQDTNLAKRIMRALERVGESLSDDSDPKKSTSVGTKCSTCVVHLNANQPREKVLHDACHVIQERILHPKHQNPLEYFEKEHPLDIFVQVSSQWGYCDPCTGRRLKHQPWALQLAWNHDPSTSNNNGNNSSDGNEPFSPPPVLKTVGIHTVNKTGILFFTRSRPKAMYASMAFVGGDYPHEQQWRGEGLLCPVTMSECKLLNVLPPGSLVAWTSACRQYEEQQNNIGNKEQYRTVAEQPEELRSLAESFRHGKADPLQYKDELALAGTLFVPLRIEVLIGGPSSPGGPRRYEWLRGSLSSSSSNTSENPIHSDIEDFDYDETTGWGMLRPILPFGSAPVVQPQMRQPHHDVLKPMTLAVTGTHCSGKTTLGRMLASALGWSFQEELGTILRDVSHLDADGHRLGDGSGDANASLWDDRIYQEEVRRDDNSGEEKISRIVESWHVGNLNWALYRLDIQAASSGSALSNNTVDREWGRVQSAIENEMERSCVLVVHLEVATAQVTVRRRKANEEIIERLPMKHSNESGECIELHRACDIDGKKNSIKLQNECHFPFMVVDNSNDGKAHMEEAVRKIVTFIHEQQWRRGF